MAMSNVTPFYGTAFNNSFQTINNTDSTTPKLLFTAGANGSAIRGINATTTDTSTAAFLQLYQVPASTLSISGITRSTTTATATTAAAHGLATGDWVIISGADQTNYNGLVQITVTGATTFTYTVTDSGASPATGTIVYKNLYRLTCQAVAAKSGTDAAGVIGSVNLINSTIIPTLKLDNAGNRVLQIMPSGSLYVAALTAIASGKVATIAAYGEDY
jgi:hypothetical protein